MTIELQHPTGRPRHSRPRLPRAAMLTALLLVLTAAASAVDIGITEHPADDPLVLSGELSTRIQLLDGWRYHPGDNPEWSAPQLDDSSWAVSSSLLPTSEDPPGGWPGIGWFRRRLTLGEGMPPTALAVRIEHWGASEVYLDGQLVARTGTVSAQPENERPEYANDFAGCALVPGRTHVLAVRYSNSRGNLLAGRVRGFGFNMRSVESAAASYNRWSRDVLTAPMGFAGAFAALAVLHLLLFAFRPASKEHVFFSLFAALTATGLALEISLALETDLIARLAIFKVTVAVGVAAVLVGLVLVNVLFRRRHGWTTWALAAAGAAMVAMVATWSAFLSTTPIRVFFLLAFFEMLRVSVAALLRREADAWIVAAAFALLAFTTLASALARFAGFPVPNRIASDTVLIVVALAFSVFISRRAGRTARELEKRLGEVQELSQRALEQERRAIQEEAERRLLEAENARRSEELEAARRLQLAMLPHTAPEIPGLDLAYRMLTATEVGGDYVDVRVGEAGRTLLTVGDATSHGLQAGMVVAVAKSLFGGGDPDESPADVLRRIGAGLRSLRERYASMAMVVAAIEDGRLQVASAGMPPVLIRRAATGAVEEILLPGVPLGTLADTDYPVHELPIAFGDVVLMMSDGAAEAVDARGEAFGYGRVTAHLERFSGATAEQIVDGLVASVTAFSAPANPHDDVTILALIVT